REFWAVTAVTAVMPWTPRASMVFRSAWMPAPPPESEPAIARTRGGVDVMRASLTAAGRSPGRPLPEAAGLAVEHAADRGHRRAGDRDPEAHARGVGGGHVPARGLPGRHPA